MNKIFISIMICAVLFLSGCPMVPLEVYRPLSITVTRPASGTAYVLWDLDLTSSVYPGNVDVYYSTTNDIATATVSGGHAGSATITGLGSGSTYYFWIVDYGYWAGQKIESEPYPDPTAGEPCTIM